MREILDIRDNTSFISFLLGILPFTLIIAPAFFTLIIVVLFLLRFEFRKLKFKHLKLEIIFYVSFLLMHIVSILYTDNLLEGLNLIKKRLLLVIIPLVLYFNVKQFNYRVIFSTFVLSMFILCLYTNINSLLHSTNYNDYFVQNVRFDYSNLMMRSVHPPYFALLLNITISLLLYDMIFLKRKHIIIKGLLIVYFSHNLLLLTSQMGLISLIILVFIYLLTFNLKLPWRIIFVLIICLSSFILWKNKDVYLEKYYSKENYNFVANRLINFFENGDPIREENWVSYVNVFQKNIFFGVGIGDAIDEVQKYRDISKWNYQNEANAHNQYLEELVHFGLIGISFIIFILILLIRAIKERDILFVSILLLLTMAMTTESLLNRQLGIFIFSFFIFLLYFSKYYEQN